MKIVYPVILMMVLTLMGCTSKNEDVNTPKTVESVNNIPEYTFAIHPLHNPSYLFEVFNPMIEHLNHCIPDARFKLEASRDYATFDQKLINQTVDFALPNPYQTLIAIEHQYRVIAKMGDDFNFKGIILVRKDSGIEIPTDLKGKSVSYPAPTALAATMLPQNFLQNNGLDINKDIENKYVGSQESSIMNVFMGTTEAGATWPPPWKALSDKRPELKEQLKVIWETQALPNNGVVAHQSVPKTLANQVQAVLINLHNNAEGQAILKNMYLSKYEPATNQTYQSVKDFIDNFNRNVRPLQDHSASNPQLGM